MGLGDQDLKFVVQGLGYRVQGHRISVTGKCMRK
jgi:hypothetical protein